MVILAAGLLVAQGPAATVLAGTSPGPDGSDGTAADEDPNRLIVEAGTGRVVDWVDRDAEQTHVSIVGVDPSAPGFTLSDPTGHRVFVDQVSRSDGIVEFWYIPLVPGIYTVTRSAEGFDEQVTRFETVSVLASRAPALDAPLLTGWSWPLGDLAGAIPIQAAASHGGSGCGGTYQGEAACPGTGDRCRNVGTWHRVDSERLWTPRIIAASPYKGSAQATESASEARTFFLMANGWRTETSVGHGIEATGGRTSGFYELANWGLYQYYQSGCAWATPTDRYTAKVIDWTGWRVTQDLTGPSRLTGEDDTTVFQRHGYRSVETMIRYEDDDAGCVDTVGGPGGSLRYGRENLGYGRAKVRIGQMGLTIAEFGIELSDSTQTLFTYTFPGDHRWLVDQVDGRGSALAFKNVDGDPSACSQG